MNHQFTSNPHLPSHLEKTNCIGNLSDQISIKIERENASKFESEKKNIRSTQLLLEFVIPTAYLAQERGEEKGEN